ncbi:hypothetical protein ACE6H2_007244 [Prunus campanulata]
MHQPKKNRKLPNSPRFFFLVHFSPHFFHVAGHLAQSLAKQPSSKAFVGVLGLSIEIEPNAETKWFFVRVHSNEIQNALKSQEAEKHLSDMVLSKALVAKIDWPIGIVCFQTAKDSNNVLNSWATNLEKLPDLVEKSCHQIHKETMVHKAALKV